MNSYELSRNWFDFCFENPEKIKPNHIAVYFFAIEHCNRLGWKPKFGFPTSMAMEATGIKSYNTFSATLNDIVSWGFIKIIEKSKNQYSSNIIALSNFNKALDKALDKAFIKHNTKQSESTIQSTSESISSIDKQYNQKTNEPINQEQVIVETEKVSTELNPVNADTPTIKKTASTEIVNAKPKKEKSDVPENVRLLRADIRNFFLEYYEKKINMKYYWTPKDAVALIEVVKKIEFQYPTGHNPTDQEILNSFKHCVTAINDRWILANLSMTIINSKSNEIFNQIKNPNHGKLDHKQRAELAFIELKAKGLY